METIHFNNLGQWTLHKSKDRFDPTAEYDTPAGRARKDWTTNPDPKVARDAKYKIPYMTGDARRRALSKLTASTEYRKNQDTGENEFLLHRGMSGQELGQHHDIDNSQVNYPEDTRTSWTTNKKVAHRQAHYEDVPGKVVSAWVPESSLISSLRQYGGPTDYDKKLTSTEDEWIVGHDKPFEHHSINNSVNPRTIDDTV